MHGNNETFYAKTRETPKKGIQCRVTSPQIRDVLSGVLSSQDSAFRSGEATTPYQLHSRPEKSNTLWDIIKMAIYEAS